MNLSKILSLTKLPKIVTRPAITERVDTLVAMLNEKDLTQPPNFLEAVRTNAPMQEELKKKKTVSLFGGNDELYTYCHMACENLSKNYRSLAVGANIARNLLKNKTYNPNIYFSEHYEQERIAQFLNGFCLANYKFDKKSAKRQEDNNNGSGSDSENGNGNGNGNFRQIDNLTIFNEKFNLNDPLVKFHLESAKYPLFCREVLNTRANEANTEAMLELCKEIAKAHPSIKIEYIVGDELQKKGLNLLYDVGKGGPNDSSLVCMKYEGNPNDSENVIALVGKGVCFDTGGMNLKPTGSIETMYYDKGGACTVLAAFLGAVEMKLPVNIVCTMAFVENSMSDRALHPKDIVTSYKGLTVEIGNTDAEGRLILADAMTYTQWKYQPKTLLEFSTLTGAIKIALGNETAGLFTNDDNLALDLFRSSQETYEGVWRLPITDEHRDDMKSPVADLNNKAKNVSGGACKAAAFLENFVEKGVKWAHIDIAGTGFRDNDKFVYSSGATGHGVKLLLNYLKRKGEGQ